MKNTLADFYLTYVNEFLTLSAYSDYNHMDMDTCAALLKMGKQYHEERAYLFKCAELRTERS